MDNTQKIGWNFSNSYARLSKQFFTRINPTPVTNPQLVLINKPLAQDLGLQLEQSSNEELAQLLSGNILANGAEPIAQAYAGHQFGYFTILGDGRAHLLGEHITPKGKHFDIQLKGSGQTPYARRGDGRAALGPMLREYIISEAMYSLGVSTTRSLAVVTTGEQVIREAFLPGAVLTRVASSHIRVGTFEFSAQTQNIKLLKQLADYTINRHFPKIIQSNQPYLDLLLSVMDRQITLVNDWLRIGFIHGVLNTDNVTVSGETIDYGPCAFMDKYNPRTVFSAIDQMGRYAYANQPPITQWNLARLADALLPLIHKDQNEARALAENVINTFEDKFKNQWLSMMRGKLGLLTQEKEDAELISALLKWMHHTGSDYTNTFHDLTSQSIPEDKPYQSQEFKNWWQHWQDRLNRNDQSLQSSLDIMRSNNPVIIPRNHNVEAALSAAEEQFDLTKLQTLLQALSTPYEHKPDYSHLYQPPKPEERIHQTFCGT
jgi:uncharacterized protein YdiU (UPF0061 family)